MTSRDEATDPTEPDVEALSRRVRAFVAATVEDAEADGAVVPLDGDTAAAVVAALAADALGPDRVTALVLPAHLTSEAAANDAEAVARSLGLDPERVHLGPVAAAFREAVGAAGTPADDLVASERALARLRATVASYVAAVDNAVVFGGATRTELLLGSAPAGRSVDALPLGDAYATEVTALADALDVPAEVTAGGVGTLDDDATDLGVSPGQLDTLLAALVDDGAEPEAAARRAGVPERVAGRVLAWHEATALARGPPATPGESAQTLWR